MTAPITIYHRDTIYTAYRICRSRQIWSNDGHQQANFHEEKFGGGSICGDEVTLIFEWDGPLETTPTQWPASPNILYRIPWDGNKNSLWSLVLFPGTEHGLKLVGLSHATILDNDLEFDHKKFLLSAMASLIVGGAEITVPIATKRRRYSCPPMPRPSIGERLRGLLPSFFLRRSDEIIE
jgi:hypothetical protein